MGINLNLLYTLTSYPPSTGGAQLHMHQIVKMLNEHHFTQVITFWNSNRFDWLLGTTIKSSHPPYDYSIDGINVHKINFSTSERHSLVPWVIGYYPLMNYAVPNIARLIQRQLHDFSENTSLIHNVRIGREPLSYASLFEARKKDIPFVFTPVHHPRWSGLLYRQYIKLYKEADAVIALTKAERDELAHLGVKEDRIFITGIGPLISEQPKPEQFRQNTNIGDCPIVLFLGQMYRYKGVKSLLDATKLVWAKIPEVYFVFIGPKTSYSNKVFSEINNPRIIEMGVLDLETKTNALAACNLLCVPSTQESFGGVYTEAWSFGRPVIGCNIPAVSQVIKDCENGFLVKQNSSEIADRIITLLLDEKLSRTLGNNGRQEVEKKYNWERITRLTEDIYLSLM